MPILKCIFNNAAYREMCFVISNANVTTLKFLSWKPDLIVFLSWKPDLSVQASVTHSWFPEEKRTSNILTFWYEYESSSYERDQAWKIPQTKIHGTSRHPPQNKHSIPLIRMRRGRPRTCPMQVILRLCWVLSPPLFWGVAGPWLLWDNFNHHILWSPTPTP